MKQKLAWAAAAVALAGLVAWPWYWFSYGGRAAAWARDADPKVRMQAVRALAGKSNPLARRTLLQLSRDPDTDVALYSVKALAEGGSGSCRQVLVELLSSGATPAVRGEAAAALGNFPGLGLGVLTRPLLEDPSPEVRCGAARGLMRLRSRAAVPALFKALSDREQPVRLAAISALDRTLGIRFDFQSEADEAVRRRQLAYIKKLLDERKLL